ncbi:hypothetical protein [Pseudomonas chlororaphis]|uniref:hypothetical protein n=1 Tax=Pseudomonas chlororaphis TaxID=587753 RepID=UPI001B311BEA|nr:hypothetical protein [Pseudomonas chlororaphis]QTT89452.1 hypothetical protein HUT28_19385 [Pseudomonas chlororaphis]
MHLTTIGFAANVLPFISRGSALEVRGHAATLRRIPALTPAMSPIETGLCPSGRARAGVAS